MADGDQGADDGGFEARTYRGFIAGIPEPGAGEFTVSHPYDGTEVARVSIPTAEQVSRAVAAAVEVAPRLRALPAYHRAEVLDEVSRGLASRADEFAEIITAESGKPLLWAGGEVQRAVSVFRIAAEEARRDSGDLRRLDTSGSGEGRMAITRRYPRGPVLGISPFNFPLNLVAHKIAPALAVGAPIVLKPASRTPLSALLLGELLAATDLPAGAFSILPLAPGDEGNAETMRLVRDERLPVVSFTGSGPVGWSIADAVPRKQVVLELGGNGAVVVCPDWPDLDFAASRIATFANYQAGQSCIAVQRVIVDASIIDDFLPRLLDAVRSLVTGSPHDPEVEVGPLVDEDAARRVQGWVAEAVAAGGKVLTGGTRDGATVEPTVLIDVPHHVRAWSEEIFGPVLVVSVADGVAEAFDQVNASRYGLQVGVFTRDVTTAFTAMAELRVGGVIIGDVPSYRADQMPYGGTKASGIGREGVRSAMDDLTEQRVMVLTDIPL